MYERISPADKGRATVVIDRAEYDGKMSSLLDEPKTYKKLAKDPTPGLEQKMNGMLLWLKKSGSIPDALYDRLQSSTG